MTRLVGDAYFLYSFGVKAESGMKEDAKKKGTNGMTHLPSTLDEINKSKNSSIKGCSMFGAVCK